VVTYGKRKSDIDYRTQDNSFFEPPISVWTPAIAPSGIVFYTGAAFPDWENNLFVAALAGRHLRRLEVENHRVTEQQVLLPEINERIRDVAVGPNGALYVLTDSLRGRVLKIGPTGKDPICAFAAPL
ncbi:MAG: PQQ-dependent sugar dehydrogenase, partial [Gammaproteobacteria bacterium]